jgi:hypothetical protein
MADVKDGGPAFPAHDYIVGNLNTDGFQKLGETRGMSLRDYFAGQAMQACLSKLSLFGTADGAEVRLSEDRVNRLIAAIVRGSYFTADAMLKARESTHG